MALNPGAVDPTIVPFRGFNIIIYDRTTAHIAVIYHNDANAFTLPGSLLPFPLIHDQIVADDLPTLTASMGLEVIIDADPPMTMREVFMGLTEIWACYITVLERDNRMREILDRRGQQCLWHPIPDALSLLAMNVMPPELRRGRSFRFLEAFDISGQYY